MEYILLIHVLKCCKQMSKCPNNHPISPSFLVCTCEACFVETNLISQPTHCSVDTKQFSIVIHLIIERVFHYEEKSIKNLLIIADKHSAIVHAQKYKVYMYIW